MNSEALVVTSEIKELEFLLAHIPSTSVIDRMSLEARLAEVKNTLASLPQRAAQKARITFRGNPVFGSHGIFVGFGAKAIDAFAEAVAAMAAALGEGLHDSGPIPDRDKNQLLLTGTAIGSFGFELELPANECALLPEVATKPIEAMAKIESLFRLAAEGSDDDVAEAIEEVHPRAIGKVRDFLEMLVQHHAWCTLELSDRSFSYDGFEQVKNSFERLKTDNIHKHEETCRGAFQGILPTSRTFEFRLSAAGGLLKGKIDKSIDDPDALNREWLYKPAIVKFGVMRVGQGRPRYSLMELNEHNPALCT